MSHVTNVHVHSEDRQCTQYNDKNERKKHVLKETTWHKRFLCISESHLGSSYMSFGSEVMVTRFNRRKERMNTMMGISHFTKYLYISIICNCL